MKKLLTLLCALTIMVSCGCGKTDKPDGFPKIYPCEILVTQEGVPLVGANVILNPQDDSIQRWSVGGTTDENGIALIATHGKYAGAPEGEFIVTILKEEIEQKTGQNPGDHEVRNVGTAKISRFVEEKYTKTETSPLRVTINKKQPKRIELDAGKKTKITKNLGVV